MLVHDVTDADGRRYFEEIWRDAPVQSRNAFSGNYRPEYPGHCERRRRRPTYCFKGDCNN